MKQLDDTTFDALKPGDVVLLHARVVDVFSSDLTVDIIGAGSRFRVHPKKSLIAAVEPHVVGEVDIIERLCGPHGRFIADPVARERVSPRALAG